MPNISIISECIPCSRIYPRRTARGRTLCTTSWACRSSEPARKSSTSAKWRLREDPRQIYRPGRPWLHQGRVSWEACRCCESRRESIVTRRGYANSGRTRLWHHHRACGRVMCAACWSCFCIWQPSAVLSSVSPLQKAWSARMNVNARGDDSYCSEHCVAPTRVVGEHGLSGSGRRLASVTAAQMRPLCS